VVAKDIDEAVLTVIRKQAEILLDTADLGELSAKGDAAQELSGFEKRIAECGERRQQFYESFILREIDRSEYLKLKEKCSAEIDRLNNQANALKAEIRARAADRTVLAIAKTAAAETTPHKEIVDALIRFWFFPATGLRLSGR
jgi:hypothetical protein